MKLKLTKTQLENIENKSMLLLPIAENIDFIDESDNYISIVIEKSATMNLENVGNFSSIESALSYLLKYHCPVQKGDKDIWIAEEFMEHKTSLHNLYVNIYYRADKPSFASDLCWQPASQMTKDQSRYTINKILDVRVVKVHDIGYEELIQLFISPTHDLWQDLKISYNQILKEHNIDRRYEDNDYVFLVEYRYD